MIKLDLNPKTNVWARAAYEVFGVLFAIVAFVGLLVWFGMTFGPVFILIIIVVLVGLAIVYMLIAMRADELKYGENDQRPF